MHCKCSTCYTDVISVKKHDTSETAQDLNNSTHYQCNGILRSVLLRLNLEKVRILYAGGSNLQFYLKYRLETLRLPYPSSPPF